MLIVAIDCDDQQAQINGVGRQVINKEHVISGLKQLAHHGTPARAIAPSCLPSRVSDPDRISANREPRFVLLRRSVASELSNFAINCCAKWPSSWSTSRSSIISVPGAIADKAQAARFRTAGTLSVRARNSG